MHSLLTLLALTLPGFAEDAVHLAPAWPNVKISSPISLVVPPDDSHRNFLVLQRGKVFVLPKDESSSNAKLFLDLSGLHLEAGEGSAFEEGLVGFAFHPQFKDNGLFYVCHTAQDMKRSVYAEYRVSKNDPDVADPESRRVLLEVPLPYWNHHSGNMAFGPDGLLYLSIGDGGGKPGGDPFRHGQNRFSLNGKVLRIDVNRTEGSRQYGIPPENPLVGQEAVREEIFAYGFRNPWGMSFDADGDLWLADVGQELFEEINLVKKGGNYGWSFREGMGKYPPRTEEPPADTKFTDPIFVYDHTQGISITGGVVYRGSKLPEWKGQYIYGDWGYGAVWALKYDKAAQKVVSNTVLINSIVLKLSQNSAKPPGITAAMKVDGFKPTAFCEDSDHEIIALDWMGKAWRLSPR